MCHISYLLCRPFYFAGADGCVDTLYAVISAVANFVHVRKKAFDSQKNPACRPEQLYCHQ